MAKSAVIHGFVNAMELQSTLKRLTFLFDAIYVNDNYLHHMPQKSDDQVERMLTKQQLLADIEPLIEKGILIPHKSVVEKLDDEMNPYAHHVLRYNRATGGIHPTFPDVTEQLSSEYKLRISDFQSRVNARHFASKSPSDRFIPLVTTADAYRLGELAQPAFLFTFDSLPLPHSHTPWETIYRMRNDDELRESYENLLNFIVTLSMSSVPITEMGPLAKLRLLAIEYVKKYLQYERYPQLVKIKLLTIGNKEYFDENFKANYREVFEEMLEFEEIQVSLTQAEKELIGQEIAYINLQGLNLK